MNAFPPMTVSTVGIRPIGDNDRSVLHALGLNINACIAGIEAAEVIRKRCHDQMVGLVENSAEHRRFEAMAGDADDAQWQSIERLRSLFIRMNVDLGKLVQVMS